MSSADMIVPLTVTPPATPCAEDSENVELSKNNMPNDRKNCLSEFIIGKGSAFTSKDKEILCIFTYIYIKNYAHKIKGIHFRIFLKFIANFAL